jgi:hypothetical protein
MTERGNTIDGFRQWEQIVYMLTTLQNTKIPEIFSAYQQNIRNETANKKAHWEKTLVQTNIYTPHINEVQKYARTSEKLITFPAQIVPYSGSLQVSSELYFDLFSLHSLQKAEGNSISYEGRRVSYKVMTAQLNQFGGLRLQSKYKTLERLRPTTVEEYIVTDDMFGEKKPLVQKINTMYKELKQVVFS